MLPFTRLEGVAAALPLADLDTDKIIPGRFLKTVKRTGLGVHLFDPLRYGPDGGERDEFVLNREPYRRASILVAGDNFGCGSSREHAPWALLDFGIRCVIAPSFADIFAANAVKNGLLPARLPAVDCAMLSDQPRLFVDLDSQTLGTPDGIVFNFEIAASARESLLDGSDEISITLAYADAIAAYEQLHDAR
jgi:3-isopropylmalate/(R)-2-methylmalate dehydratase small subunit